MIDFVPPNLFPKYTFLYNFAAQVFSYSNRKLTKDRFFHNFYSCVVITVHLDSDIFVSIIIIIGVSFVSDFTHGRSSS